LGASINVLIVLKSLVEFSTSREGDGILQTSDNPAETLRSVSLIPTLSSKKAARSIHQIRKEKIGKKC
jgi:hypothetical protein